MELDRGGGLGKGDVGVQRVVNGRMHRREIGCVLKVVAWWL